MADTKISALPSASALTGGEIVPIVQSGATTQTTVDSVAAVAWTTSQLWAPADLGFLGWNYDPVAAVSGLAMSTAGLVYVQKVKVNPHVSPITVTNVHLMRVTAGATLTSGQCFAALYDGSKSLKAQTADQATLWATSTGGNNLLETYALSSAQSLTTTTGFCYVAIWFNGTTGPSFLRSVNQNVGPMNGLLSAANSRSAACSAGTTTTGPGTLGTFTAHQESFWVGIS